MFLRNYLEKSKESTKNNNNQRVRIHNDQLANEKKPIDAQEWTIKGYNGELQRAVSIACNE